MRLLALCTKTIREGKSAYTRFGEVIAPAVSAGWNSARKRCSARELADLRCAEVQKGREAVYLQLCRTSRLRKSAFQRCRPAGG